ncbi:hypothetical protein BX600DRAFT_513161 [Xylariales sp. PMI_506]|nr:hypothetical protein BX600DRAFT_513161 [Xylariales sp. PMI_506]
MISCGTVTIDKPHSPDRLVLILWNKNTAAWQLPKGRKNVHEDFGVAALRETTEETSVPVRPLYLRFGTRLTLPEKEEQVVADKLKRRCGIRADCGKSNDDGISSMINKDIFYASTYTDPATGAFRHIYWYAATPDKHRKPDRKLLGKNDIGKREHQWVTPVEAIKLLKMANEREAVALAVYYAEKMESQDWVYSEELSENDSSY